MRFFLLIFSMILFGCSTDIHSQIKQFNDFPKEVLEQMDKMGIDEKSLLTKIEADYFNILLQDLRNNFDFCGKKVAFLTGSLGRTIGYKKEYFEGELTNLQRNNPPNFVQLFIFNEAEVKQTGYDAVIIIGSKKYLTKKEVVKRLKDLR